MTLTPMVLPGSAYVSAGEVPSGKESTARAAHAHPILSDFMGLNVHTVQFKPELYAPVCRLLRDYHPFNWDVGNDTAHKTEFPMTVNGVDWGQMYNSWLKGGFEIDDCVIFDQTKPEEWKNLAADARAYGEAYARFFGHPGRKLVTSVEVGNEPSKYTAEQYHTILENMAKGIRAGDPKLTIATCAVMTGKPDEWSKPLSAIEGLEKSYDVLNVHSYAFKDGWPTWRRSHPEDPSITFLKSIQGVIDWRDAHVAGKQVWLTEFGFDSSTRQPDPNGPWGKWIGITDEQQAQFTVRSFLVLSAMNLDRAYLYFFNDDDEPQLHGASGITRKFKPKPSFYAMAHLYKSLGDYRFEKAIVRKDGELYCFEYVNAKHEHAFVAWSPTSGVAPAKKKLALGKAVISRAEQMSLAAGDAKVVEHKATPDGVEVEISESPVILWAR